jgi:hypothetical protein
MTAMSALVSRAIKFPISFVLFVPWKHGVWDGSLDITPQHWCGCVGLIDSLHCFYLEFRSHFQFHAICSFSFVYVFKIPACLFFGRQYMS